MAAAFLKLKNVISTILLVTIDLASSTPPKSVNVALETSFLFEPNDVRQMATLMENSRNFLDKLESLFSPKENLEPTFRSGNDTNGYDIVSDKSNGTITRFLTEVGGVVLNYDEDEVRMLATALNDEIARNYVSNPKFHDMFENVVIRTFIKNTVKAWTATPPLTLKLEIANYITSNESSPFIIFFRNLNRFFESDKGKLEKLVTRFAKARKTRNFSKPLEKTFKLIFDRYETMEDNLKLNFRGELDKLAKYIEIHYKHRLNIPNDDVRRSYSQNYHQTTLKSTQSVKDNYGNSYTSFENANEIKFDKEIRLSVHTVKY